MSGVSRRNLFRLFAKPLAPLHPKPAPETRPDPTRVAVIQGRHCTAIYDGCRRCVDQCPVPGALVMDAGLPMVDPGACNGCTVCQQVCPAPTNAVRMLPRP
ncbi:MAG: hypothetical protein KF791_05715 [Verrucomicrobiae bacterium]|nr:hypothetical protein [Verrucomicrobiae bacterium]